MAETLRERVAEEMRRLFAMEHGVFAYDAQVFDAAVEVALKYAERAEALEGMDRAVDVYRERADDFRAQAEAQSDRNEVIQRHLDDQKDATDHWARLCGAERQRAEAAEKALAEQRELAYRLAVLALQSARYSTDQEFADCVDAVIARCAPPPGGEEGKREA